MDATRFYNNVRFLIALQSPLNGYIKEESRKKSLLDLKVSDFIEDKLPQFEAKFQQDMTPKYEKDLREHYDKCFKCYGKKYTIENLKDGLKEPFNKFIKEEVQVKIKVQLDAFRCGETWVDMHDWQNVENPRRLAISLLDFKNGSENDLVGTPKKQSYLETISDNRQIDESFDRSEFLSIIKEINRVPLQLLYLKWNVYVARKVDKPITQISDEEFEKYIPVYASSLTKLAQQTFEQKKRAAEEAAQKLIAETSKKKISKSRNKHSSFLPKKKTEEETLSKPPLKATITTVDNQLLEIVNQLNDKNFSFSYELHMRIVRWRTKKVLKIREFEDFDPATNQKVKHYEKMNEAELKMMQRWHNFAGVERFMSFELLILRYSFYHQYIERGTQKIVKGRGLFCCLSYENKFDSGILYLGIGDDKVIYHALFEPSEDRFIFPALMLNEIDAYQSGKEEETIKEAREFDLTLPYTFSIIRNDILQLDIGEKKEERVIAHFYPLN